MLAATPLCLVFHTTYNATWFIRPQPGVISLCVLGWFLKLQELKRQNRDMQTVLELKKLMYEDPVNVRAVQVLIPNRLPPLVLLLYF